eukprot:12910350-Ditylum_brightwellii.AAC.1
MKNAEQFSTGINITFGLDNCAILNIKNSVYSTTNILPEIPKLDDDANKGDQYLSIMQEANFLHVEVKLKMQKEYISKLRKIINSYIPANAIMTAVCTFDMPIL